MNSEGEEKGPTKLLQFQINRDLVELSCLALPELKVMLQGFDKEKKNLYC